MEFDHAHTRRVAGATAGKVAVIAPQRLLRDAVSAVLAAGGFLPVSTPFPVNGKEIIELRARLADQGATTGLVIEDVSDAAQLRELAALLCGIPINWLVLCGDAPRPAWQALRDAGARAVLPNTTTVESLVPVLHEFADGPDGHAPPKLGVNSQLQVVAALREANEWLTD